MQTLTSERWQEVFEGVQEEMILIEESLGRLRKLVDGTGYEKEADSILWHLDALTTMDPQRLDAQPGLWSIIEAIGGPTAAWMAEANADE